MRIGTVPEPAETVADLVLDNPAWHALTGPQATVAERHGDALRYNPAFAPFAAMPDEPTAAAWEDLRTLVGPGGIAILFRPLPVAPVGMEIIGGGTGVQMVATTVRTVEPEPDIEVLGPRDVPAMLDLVERTQPGPFALRTAELGRYLGIRSGEALVAMAGERMHPPGYTEISAVCTADGHRGRGYGARLVTELVRQIEARGETAILHAVADNFTAIRLYEWLGFELRTTAEVVVVRA